jgi:hypothetical protein
MLAFCHFHREASVKDIYQVLREKEQQIARVRQEVEALRFCAPLLAEAGEIQAQNAAVPANRWPAEAQAESQPNPFHN